MARYDFRSPRLYVEAALDARATVALERAQAHYLGAVLRLRAGDRVLVFNGRDGEWSATIVGERRPGALLVDTRTREQTTPADLHYLFAPLKAARLDYMTQKAVEMGASLLQPVLTRHGQVTKVDTERMRANAIEAAEQCGILSPPAIAPPVALARLLAERDAGRWLVFCDEDAEVANPVGRAQRRAAVAACRADRARRRFRRGRARCAAAAAERGPALARSTHPARRYGRGRSAGARSGRARRLALNVSVAALAAFAQWIIHGLSMQTKLM